MSFYHLSNYCESGTLLSPFHSPTFILTIIQCVRMVSIIIIPVLQMTEIKLGETG